MHATKVVCISMFCFKGITSGQVRVVQVIYVKIIEYVPSYNQEVASVVSKNAFKNALYDSPTIQNRVYMFSHLKLEVVFVLKLEFYLIVNESRGA